MRTLHRHLPLCLLAVASGACAVEKLVVDTTEIGLDAYTVLRIFVDDSQGRLKKLDEYMTTLCVAPTVEGTQALFKKMQKDWDDVLVEQQEAFSNKIKEAEGLYGRYKANKGRTTGKRIEHKIVRKFPNRKIYTEWLEPSEDQWNWLFSGSAVFFKVVKRFEAQTYLNGIGVKNAKDNFEYLEGLCRELHDALEAAQADPSKENIRACRNLASYPTMVTKIWDEQCTELNTFLKDRKPANYTEEKNMILDWILPDEDCVCSKYKTDWGNRVKDLYGKYEKSFKAVEVAWVPLRVAAYMHVDMPLFNGWAASDFQSRFDNLMRELERK